MRQEQRFDGRNPMNIFDGDKRIFNIDSLVPFKEGKINEEEILDNEKTKLVISSFDSHTRMNEHHAEGNEIMTALEGEAVVVVEGKEYELKKGESLRLHKGEAHYVVAEKRFKVIILVSLE